jgi:DNA relaxase NicK
MTDHYDVMEAGIDYITVSATAGQAQFVQQAAERLGAKRERLGDSPKRVSALGYDGVLVGPVFFGFREDGKSLFRVSGPVASEAFGLVATNEMHFTRIDIQMTIRPAGRLPNPHLAKTVVRESNRRRLANKNQNYSHVRMIDGNGKGDTAMVGSRSSGKYARIYDKGAESGDERYEGCWRYELEYKAEYADLVRDQLVDAYDREQVIVDLIVSQMEVWEIPAFVSRGEHRPLRGAPSLPTDNERSLEWIRTQVLPTINRLRAAGLQPELDELLNL